MITKLKKIAVTIVVALVVAFLGGCESTELLNPASSILNNQTQLEKKYKTKNVIIVVIDGPRFSETWGDPKRVYIPYLANQLAPLGSIYNSFYNRGPTFTTAGHTAITTGHYQIMQNDGSAFPYYPSVFQLYLNQTQNDPKAAQIITSKSKLDILADCINGEWRGKYNPITNTHDRPDSLTFEAAVHAIRHDQPNLMLIHFKGPDAFGHSNNWPGYLDSIRETDEYLWELWNLLQSDESYRNHSTLLVTNDHGRHLDHVKDGFISHGDQCEGCLHINLLAIGPDFKSGQLIDLPRQSVDIAPTIAELLGFNIPQTTGDVLYELFQTQ